MVPPLSTLIPWISPRSASESIQQTHIMPATTRRKCLTRPLDYMLHRCTVISVMTLVSELDLPAFDYTAPDFSADRYHQQLAETRQRGWLAKSPLAYIVLDRDGGEFFLRSRKTAFPGRQIAEFFGVTGGPLAEHIDANILNLTGEQHRRLRALVGPALTPRAADRWRPVMRGFLENLWARGAASRGCDFLAGVARRAPVTDDRHRARRTAQRRGEIALLVHLGAAAVRHPGPRDQPRQHRAGRHRGAGIRDGSARGQAGRSRRRPDQRPARGPRGGSRRDGWAAVRRGVRAARGEPAGRGHRHHRRAARARGAALRRASRPVEAASRRARPA